MNVLECYFTYDSNSNLNFRVLEKTVSGPRIPERTVHIWRSNKLVVEEMMFKKRPDFIQTRLIWKNKTWIQLRSNKIITARNDFASIKIFLNHFSKSASIWRSNFEIGKCLFSSCQEIKNPKTVFKIATKNDNITRYSATLSSHQHKLVTIQGHLSQKILLLGEIFNCIKIYE